MKKEVNASLKSRDRVWEEGNETRPRIQSPQKTWTMSSSAYSPQTDINVAFFGGEGEWDCNGLRPSIPTLIHTTTFGALEDN